MATTTVAEVTSAHLGSLHSLSRPPVSILFSSTLDVLPGPLLHTTSRMTTLFVRLYLITSATSHAIPIPNDRPSPTLALPGTISYSTFNDLL